MTTSNERSAMTKGLMLGLVVGGVAAAALALLYAPKSGSELRGDIRKKGKKLAKDLETLAEGAKLRTAEVVQRAQDRIENEETRLAGAVKAGVDAFKEARERT